MEKIVQHYGQNATALGTKSSNYTDTKNSSFDSHRSCILASRIRLAVINLK